VYRSLSSVTLGAFTLAVSASAHAPGHSYLLRFHPPVGKTYHYRQRMTYEFTPQITISVVYDSAMVATGYANGACTLKTAYSNAKSSGFPDDPRAQEKAKEMEASIDGFQAIESVAPTGRVLSTKGSGKADGPIEDGMCGVLGQLFVAKAVSVGSSWITKFVDKGEHRVSHVKLLKMSGTGASAVAMLQVMASKGTQAIGERGTATIDLATGILRSAAQTADHPGNKATLSVELVDK
jgi:hypothetical protein